MNDILGVVCFRKIKSAGGVLSQSLFNSGIVFLTYPFTPREADNMLNAGDTPTTM